MSFYVIIMRAPRKIPALNDLMTWETWWRPICAWLAAAKWQIFWSDLEAIRWSMCPPFLQFGYHSSCLQGLRHYRSCGIGRGCANLLISPIYWRNSYATLTVCFFCILVLLLLKLSLSPYWFIDLAALLVDLAISLAWLRLIILLVLLFWLVLLVLLVCLAWLDSLIWPNFLARSSAYPFCLLFPPTVFTLPALSVLFCVTAALASPGSCAIFIVFSPFWHCYCHIDAPNPVKDSGQLA